MHEVLVYAGSVTSRDADRKYLAQSTACISFTVALRHALSLEAPSTPTVQAITKLTTPSTTTTDRSDLVLDSQRIKRVKLSYSATIHSKSLEEFPTHYNTNSHAQHFQKSPGRSRSRRSVHDTSQEHNSLSKVNELMQRTAGMAPNNETLIEQLDLAEYANVSDYIPTAPINVIKHDDQVQTGRLILSDMADHRLNRSSSTGDLGGAIDISNFTAREAIAYREHQALLRRRLSHKGLRRLHSKIWDVTKIAARSQNQDSGPQAERVTISKDSFLESKTHGHQSLENLTVSGGVNLYLTIATDEDHGQTRTPTSAERTTDESNKTDRISVERDIVSSTTVISSNQSNTDSLGRPNAQVLVRTEVSHTSISCALNGDINSVEPPNSFVLAQYNSPFYRPSFRVSATAMKLGKSVVASTDLLHKEVRAISWKEGQDDPCSLMDDSVPSFFCEESIPNLGTSSLLQVEGDDGQHTRTDPTMSFTSFVVGLPQACSTAIPNISSSAPPEESTLHKPRVDIKHGDDDRVNETPRIVQIANGADGSCNIGHIKSLAYDGCVPPEYRCGNTTFMLVPDAEAEMPDQLPRSLLDLKIPRRIKLKTRDLAKDERGYWVVDLHALQFSIIEARRLWSDLGRVVTSKNLVWVSLQYFANTIRVYCFGSCVMQIWTLIYASTRKVKQGISWKDMSGQRVIFN